jgi:hypothetical protein
MKIKGKRYRFDKVTGKIVEIVPENEVKYLTPTPPELTREGNPKLYATIATVYGPKPENPQEFIKGIFDKLPFDDG